MVKFSESESQNLPALANLCLSSDAAEASLKNEITDDTFQLPANNEENTDLIQKLPENVGGDNHEELVDGYSEEVLNNITTVNQNLLNLDAVPTVNGNSAENMLANNASNNKHTDLQDEVALDIVCEKNSDNYLNDANTLSESSNLSNPDDNDGFIPVVRKKKKGLKTPNQEHTSNLPCAEKIFKCDKNINKFSDKLPSPHLSLLNLALHSRNFPTVRTLGKTYSSVLSNGSMINSGMKKSVSLDSEGAKESSNGSSFSGISVIKKTGVNDTISLKNEQSDLFKKVETIDVSAQTDVSSISDNLKPPGNVKSESLQSNSAIRESVACMYVEETKDESSNASVVSNDSGRGDSEVSFDIQNPFYCIFPIDKVRSLIGKHGKYKSEIESQTGASFWAHTEFRLDGNTTVIAFTGLESAIENAKEMIRRRFRNVTLERWINPYSISFYETPSLPDSVTANLPLGIDIMVVVSCIYTPSYFWTQQFGHPGYHPLEDMEKAMSNHYNSAIDAPGVINPLPGHVIAVPVALEEENTNKWVRGEIIGQLENGNVLARYLDHGGEVEVPVSEIRPMRPEFFSISFFAAKCCLYGILPAENQWSDDACAEFKRLCSGVHFPLIKVIHQVPEGYFVVMWAYDNELNCRVNVADVLVSKGFARVGDPFAHNEEPANEYLQ